MCAINQADDFRYEILISQRPMKLNNSRATSQKILEGTITNKTLYAIGKTKVFLRVGVLAHLDKLRSILLARIVAIQASARSTLSTKRYIRHQASIAVEAKLYVRIQAASRTKAVKLRMGEALIERLESARIRHAASMKADRESREREASIQAEKENARSSTASASTITPGVNLKRPEKSPVRYQTSNGNLRGENENGEEPNAAGSVEVLEHSRKVFHHASKPSFASSLASSSSYATAYMDEVLPPVKPPRSAARVSRAVTPTSDTSSRTSIGRTSSIIRGPTPTPPERTTSLSNANDPRVNKRSSRGFSSPFFMG